MIISISGKDTYRSKEKFHSIQSLGLQKNAKQEIFDFEDVPMEGIDTIFKQLKQSLHTGSLFVEKRLIIIIGLASLPKVYYPQIKKTLHNLQDKEDIIILFYDKTGILKTHPLTKILDVVGAKIQEYPYLSEVKAIAYIHQMSIHQGLDINRAGIMYLVEYQKMEHKMIEEKSGSKGKKNPFQIDFYSIEMIFNQLHNYYGNQPINQDNLSVFLPSQKRYSIFTIAEYMYARNYSEYLQALKWLQQQGVEGIGLYGLFVSQIKNALIITLAKEEGKRYEDYLNIHPYVLKMTAQQVRLWDSKSIQKIYQYLTQGDYLIKFEGKDPFSILEGLILNMMSE